MFSDSDCSFHAEHVLKYIEMYENEIEVSNIILLGNFIDEHAFSVFVRLNPKIRQKIYNIGSSNLGLPVDSLDLPYLFVTNEYLKPSNVFVPLKEIPERTDEYFKHLLKKRTFN
jgi:hypothetical protein